MSRKNSKDAKGQASIEFLIILAIALFLMAVIVILAQSEIGGVQSIKDQTDTKNSLLDLSTAAKEVYAQGEGSEKLVYIELPQSYEPGSSYVSNDSIVLMDAGTDYAAVENFNVHGYLPSTPGGQWVTVVSEGNRVRIGSALLGFNKNEIYLVMNSNSTANSSFTVQSLWSSLINVTTVTSWNNTYVAMTGVPSLFTLNQNSTQTINLQFSSTANSVGVYSGQISFTATDGNGHNETDNIPITVDVIPYQNQSQETNYTIQGPIITGISQAPSPALVYQPLAIYVNASDVLTGNYPITGCKIQVDGSGNWSAMLPVSGSFGLPTEEAYINYTNGFSVGAHTISAECTDSMNYTGPVAYYYFSVVQLDTQGPIVESMTYTQYPSTITNVSVGGVGTDVYTGDSNVAWCNVSIDNGAWVETTPIGGSWNTTPTINFTYNIGSMSVGTHTAHFQCADSVGNIGGIYNESFSIVEVDMMLVIDRSGSMIENVTNFTDGSAVSAASTGWSWVENESVNDTNGAIANLIVELKSSATNCMSYYNASVNGNTIATGNTASTSYVYLLNNTNIAAYSVPFQVSLWLKRNATSCNADAQLLSIQQPPSKIVAVQNSSETFLNVTGVSTQAGLVSFSDTATTNKELALMTPTNQSALYAAINSLTPSGSTCIECGLDNAVDELTSSRARPQASKVIILLTDGESNVGDSVNGAIFARDNNITVYTIGYGSDVNDTELTDVALLTYGNYYFAPNVATLNSIFQSIGR